MLVVSDITTRLGKLFHKQALKPFSVPVSNIQSSQTGVSQRNMKNGLFGGLRSQLLLLPLEPNTNLNPYPILNLSHNRNSCSYRSRDCTCDPCDWQPCTKWIRTDSHI